MANPSGNNIQEPYNHGYGGAAAVQATTSGAAGAASSDHLASSSSTDWTQEEQSILEDGLAKYASESNIIRYAKIAVQLQNKTVRDVAFRCRWMTKRENSKRRKEENHLMKINNDRKGKMTDSQTSSPSMVSQNGYPSQAQGNVTNALLYSVLSSGTGQLLQQNAQALEQISANIDTLQLHENVSLFCQARDNIFKILNNLGDAPEKMKRMPELPVLDERLFTSILSNFNAVHPVEGGFPTSMLPMQ